MIFQRKMYTCSFSFCMKKFKHSQYGPNLVLILELPMEQNDLCSLQNIIWPTIFCSELSPLCINMEYLNKWGKQLWTSTYKYAIFQIMTVDFFIFFRINLVFFFHSSWSYNGFIIDLISLINTLYEIFLEKCKMYTVFSFSGWGLFQEKFVLEGWNTFWFFSLSGGSKSTALKIVSGDIFWNFTS